MTASPFHRAAPRGLRRAIESDLPTKAPAEEYRRKLIRQYDGLPGALTELTGVLTGHGLLAGRIFGSQGFNVRGCKSILEAACGNGRYTRRLAKKADPNARIVAFDLSVGMLNRARRKVRRPSVGLLAADLTRLPFAESEFDAAVCGWVLEHFSDPKPALAELARVLKPQGRLLVMVTESTYLGAMCSRLWHCRTYRRDELRAECAKVGLQWSRELWFSDLHKSLRMGGIVAEVVKA